jgi:hypothetical protein
VRERKTVLLEDRDRADQTEALDTTPLEYQVDLWHGPMLSQPAAAHGVPRANRPWLRERRRADPNDSRNRVLHFQVKQAQ